MRTIALRFVLPAMLMATPYMHGQVVAAGAAGAVAVAPHLAAAVPAVLTSAVSAGSAHVGQAVLARLATGSVLSDGTKLPVGTQLLGKVTQAVPLARGNGKSALSMAFDRFKLPNGQERPLSNSILQSIRGGRSDRSSADIDTADSDSNAAMNAQANAGARTNNSSNGGLLGGVVNGVGNTVGGVANGVGNAVGQTVNGVAQTTGSLLGVVLNSTGTLTAQGRNVSVPAGTQVSIGASANASAQ